ncbi:uncharacterized protein LOC133840178 [Drosophila sulfurigaster albostrigata]|uniref:uncharacterized protein LOC133840178 n=1 Tax=Drosophila sulfurigaster albostrigata TaxID=89887 RepID=UPI002D21EBFC|nr:uncharacterized protein LOC133840178 [Drosophila sulfurigaster albostrigata]
MAPQHKTKKIVIKIPRHPYIMAQDELNYTDRVQIRKCRVNLERIKGHQNPLTLKKPNAKRCCVRVARLPNVERNEMSVTPASSIVCSDFDDESTHE